MLSIFPLIAISIMAGLTRIITRTWISPGSFFATCWSLFLIVPITFAYDYEIDHLALWFITIFTMSLAGGSIMAFSNDHISTHKNRNSVNTFNYLILYKILIIFSTISVIGLYLLFLYAKNIYSSSNYINNWMIIPNMIAIDRYNETLNYPNIIKYSLYFIYPANLLGGLLFGLKEKLNKIKLFSIVPLILGILLGILEGSRTSIILGLVLFFSSWLSSFMLRGEMIFSKKKIIKISFMGGGILTLFTIFFVLIQWLRQGMDPLIIELLIDRIRAYFFGYLSAFSQWFMEMEIGEINKNNGLITLAGPFNLLGILERPLGFYDPINISNGVSTNIFTAYRGIVVDFSIPGSILIAFIIGFYTQLIFQRRNSSKIFDTIPISMFYAFTLYSPLISIFHYNSILFSWFILLFILFVFKNAPLDNHC